MERSRRRRPKKRDGMAEWLKEKKCLKGVMESSGIYWVPIYVTLTDNGFQVTVANAHQVKAIPGRKTDELDSQWLARVFSAGLVKPSYIPEKKIMELRSLTRLRVSLVEAQTAFKNRAHKTLQICNIRLASKLSNIFRKGRTNAPKRANEGGKHRRSRREVRLQEA